ncbi:hypothetical protein [uncultured Paracoccus sp.]|uniref:hypothetical protein n=1 Tax=uncultured Paracoccus sp. TaxID=189685 RepID=UPI00262B64E8|nr:hypothetical protein [uncultured Paracoccus sp.]
MTRAALAVFMIGLAGAAHAASHENNSTAPHADSAATPSIDASADPDASGTPLTYEMFETAISHGDLPTCPEALEGEHRFCRFTVHNDALHVFAFSEEGDQPLLAISEYAMDEISFPD